MNLIHNIGEDSETDNLQQKTVSELKDILTNYLKLDNKTVNCYESRINYEFYNRRLLDYYIYKC